MLERTFRIISNCEDYLTQERVAQALLEQITLKANKPKIFFAVLECAAKDRSSPKKKSK